MIKQSLVHVSFSAKRTLLVQWNEHWTNQQFKLLQSLLWIIKAYPKKLAWRRARIASARGNNGLSLMDIYRKSFYLTTTFKASLFPVHLRLLFTTAVAHHHQSKTIRKTERGEVAQMVDRRLTHEASSVQFAGIPLRFLLQKPPNAVAVNRNACFNNNVHVSVNV